MNSHFKETNLKFLSDFARGDTAKMKRYIEMYLKSTPRVIKELHEEVENSNWENLKLKAHSIKPQAQYMGIDELKSTLIAIETIAGGNGDKDQLKELVTAADEINARAEKELKEFLEN